MPASKDAIFYHETNIFLQGNYSKIRSLKNKLKTWEKVWQSLGATSPLLAPKGMDLFLIEEDGYPSILKEIPNPPFGVYVKGNLPQPKDMCISIVGTRKATDEGKRIGKEFGEALALRGVTIVSGLAFGLDKAAHEGALKAGGRTIAVLANGLNSVYPKSNESLAKEILKSGGALISEYPPDFEPMPFRFLERNRIVSGLSQGTLIIEAPKESGSLVTARFALDQNRDVFVIPGPVRHPNYRGSHELIRSGATLVTAPEHILEEYGLESPVQKLPLVTSEEKVILDVLSGAGKPITADAVAASLKMDIKKVNQILSFLLIKSNIKEHGTGYSL